MAATLPLQLAVAVALLAVVRYDVTAVLYNDVTTKSTNGDAAAPLTYERGDVVIAAGNYYYDGDHPLSTVEVLGKSPLPPLPVAVYGNSLSAVGSFLYSCGGRNATKCYSLDLWSNPLQWEVFLDLSVTMWDHTASTIGSHIWIVANNLLRDIDTTTGELTEYNTPFNVSTNHCAAFNDTHSFLIGVGNNDDEVWVNTKTYRPAEWMKVATLSSSRNAAGCLLFENKIFIVGGWESMTHSDVLDTSTYKIESTGDLQIGRQFARMAAIDGDPVILGGRNYDYEPASLDSIEIFGSLLQSWSIDNNRKLDQPTDLFGVAQLQV